MALWAFHNNPGIGGFGESNPILFGGSKIQNSSKERKSTRKEKKRSNESSSSSNCENRDPTRKYHSSLGRSNRGNTVRPPNNEYSTGQEDLICQIVKELVDNAVDACRNPFSDDNHLRDRVESMNRKKRIRVDIRPFVENQGFDDESSSSCRSKGHRNDVLQLTVTDTGCGMENIQRCVNAFQTSKGSRDETNRDTDKTSKNSISSGRYGIGLTLCLLHAQRCVPNSRTCISSATPQSKHLTRAFFEVDKEQDSIKCVQEEKAILPTIESGTCISLLIPGGMAAKHAWPRLRDYFTRFGLCTNLHFEVDVFAPTLSKLPIYIRSRKSENQFEPSPNQNVFEGQLPGDEPKSDDWKDLLDGDESEEDKHPSTETNFLDDCSNQNERHEFTKAVKTFWPSSNITVDNVARSVRTIRTCSDGARLSKKGTERDSTVQLEVSMAVCPDLEYNPNGDSIVESGFPPPNDNLPGKAKAASLQLVRIVNDVPIIENAEAHSCGLVHGVANKRVWGSFGLDIERSTTRKSSINLSTPSFLLRDSNLIAPFINKNRNHKLLVAADDHETNLDQEQKANKKRRMWGAYPSQNLRPAELRIGTILVVVHIRANPSSLPLPTLSKGRLPLNHKPIDDALQLGLRECMVSLQSTSRGLFLTPSQLRKAERDVRYIPAIASAASRIVCRSRNQLLRRKCLALLPNESTGKRRPLPEVTSDVENEDDNTDLEISALADVLESQLRLAIKAREKLTNKKRRKVAKGNSRKRTDEEFHDIDSDDVEEESLQGSNSDKPREESKLESTSSLSFNSQSSQELSARQRVEEPSCEASALPITEIAIGNGPIQSTNEDEDAFDDFF